MKPGYSKQSFPAIRVPNQDMVNPSVAGMFYYVEDQQGNIIGLCSCLPNAGDQGLSWGATMFTGHGSPNREWQWDGNLDKPTLTPSIDRKTHWHGHLTKGQFISC